MRSILIYCAIILYVTFGQCEIFFSPGNCPTGNNIGDTWEYNGQHCSQCICMDKGYQCKTCTDPIVPMTACYIATNGTAPFPGCCWRIVCAGESNFDMQKYNEYWKIGLGK